MREIMRGGVCLMVVAFSVALIHSCSLDNGIVKPTCQVFEVDLDQKWWYPQDNPHERSVYFRSNGLVNIEGKSDSLSFKMENCNKIRVTDIMTGDSELWIIKSLTEKDLSIQYPNNKLVVYSRLK